MLRNFQHAKETEHALDRAIAAVAEPQHGLITTPELLALGLSYRAITYRTKIGRLHRLYNGVYAVGHIPVSPHTHALAAVLACGSDAVLSHGSAATLWGLGKHWRRPFEVTAPTQRRQPRIRTHRSKTLTPRDTTRHFGIPVTSPARTVFDNAPRLTDAQLVRAVNDVRLARYLRLDALAELLDRHPQTAAAKRLSGHVERPAAAPTRSGFEDDFTAFIERYGLPEPLINTLVAGHEADVFFPAHKLVVELDGWDFHRGREQFESDRDRDADLLAAGVATVRLTRTRFDSAPDREAARLHAILRRRL